MQVESVTPAPLKQPQMLKRLKLCRIAATPLALAANAGQVKYLSENGFDVMLVTSSSDGALGLKKSDQEFFSLGPSLNHKFIEIPREIKPIADLRALLELIKLFRQERFDIVHSVTPKAGLLAAMAGWVARVPVRLHTYTGQPWVTATGLRKFLTRSADRLIALLNTHLYTDGTGQREFLTSERIVRSQRISVILEGSVAGIDLEQHDRARVLKFRDPLRTRLGIAPDAIAFCFLGRRESEKGISELVQAFRQVVEKGFDAHLILIGPNDQNRPIDSDTAKWMNDNPRIHDLGFVLSVEENLIAGDVLALPSYREGFNGAILQAAALGIPTIGSNVYGINDNLIDGKTGLLVEPRNAASLAQGFQKFFETPSLAAKLGEESLRRVHESFDMRKFNIALATDYRRRIRSP